MQECAKRRGYPSDGVSLLARNISRRECIYGEERRAEMERRTQPGYEYHSCDFMDDGVYIDMNILREYEDTGLTPEQIRELKERDTAKPPIDIEDNYGFFVCPSCGNSIYASDDFESHKFCLNCGQRIRWEE